MEASGRIDVQRLIGAVAARHGILLKPDDAAFALVTINQLLLEEVFKDLLENVRSAITDFDQAATQVQARAGSLLASQLKDAVAEIRCEVAGEISAAVKHAQERLLELDQAHSRAVRYKWIALGATCGLLLFMAGVFVGRMFW
jgi:hypothetical protein